MPDAVHCPGCRRYVDLDATCAVCGFCLRCCARPTGPVECPRCDGKGTPCADCGGCSLCCTCGDQTGRERRPSTRGRR